MAEVWGDVDGDGDVDIMEDRGWKFFLNDGKGKFTDGTASVRTTPNCHPRDRGPA
jgi:hypothetical protein